MRFSITKLEIIRLNPIAFINNPIEEQGYGYPKSLRWLDSVCEYHQTKDLSHSIRFLQGKFAHRKRTSKNMKEEEKLTQSLINYVSEHHDLNYSYKKSRLKLDIKLSDKVEIGGLIWLVNNTIDAGYATYTITDTDNDFWYNELRYPVIQNYISDKFKCPLEKVNVGLINYTNGSHQYKSYSNLDVRIALEELRDIGYKMSSVL